MLRRGSFSLRALQGRQQDQSGVIRIQECLSGVSILPADGNRVVIERELHLADL